MSAVEADSVGFQPAGHQSSVKAKTQPQLLPELTALLLVHGAEDGSSPSEGGEEKLRTVQQVQRIGHRRSVNAQAKQFDCLGVRIPQLRGAGPCIIMELLESRSSGTEPRVINLHHRSLQLPDDLVLIIRGRWLRSRAVIEPPSQIPEGLSGETSLTAQISALPLPSLAHSRVWSAAVARSFDLASSGDHSNEIYVACHSSLPSRLSTSSF